MILFFVIITLSFFFVSHNIYANLCEPFISNFYLNIIAYIALLLIGQSFWLLLNRNLNKYIEYAIYIIIFTFSVMFFYYIIIDIVRFFYFKSNIHILDFNVLTFTILLGCYGLFNRYFIKTTVYNLKSNKNIDLKIAFVSDLHIGDAGIDEKILNKMVNIINAHNVDIVILGGDIVEGNHKAFTQHEFNNFFKEIKSKHGIFAVLGNHEYYGGEPYLIAKTLEDYGNIKVLNDKMVELDNFVLIGREDNTKKFFGKNRKTLNEISSNTIDKYLIVVDHNPAFFNESVKKNADLQLSGHTHNGQFFPFTIIVKFFYEKAYGLLKKDNTTLITSSGLGTWRIPIKLGSKPEIVIIHVR